MKKDNAKTFVDELYPSPPKKSYPTKNIIYNHVDEFPKMDLMDMSDYKITNKKGFKNIFNRLVILSKNNWCVPLKTN